MSDGPSGGANPVQPAGHYGPTCLTPVTRAAMVHWWDQLTFIHWRFDPADVQRLLPTGLTVETFDGSAWVGLVPFFLRVGLPKVPSVALRPIRGGPHRLADQDLSVRELWLPR